MTLEELIYYTHCPLCKSEDLHLYKKAACHLHARYDPALSAVLNWQRCHTCQHIFRDGFYTEEALKIVFKGTNPNQIVGYDIENQRRISAKMIDKVLPYQHDGIWMDVGFGNGSLLFTAAEYGFHPFGLDLRPNSVEDLKKYKIPALYSDIAHIQTNAPMSVISLCDVLEHISYPNIALEKCYTLLKPNGVLFLSMPNTESIAWDDLDQKNANPYWGEIEHCHNFSRTRLYQLLAEKGFKAVQYGISERYRVCMEVIAIKQ